MGADDPGLLDRHVYAIPLRSRFRGLDAREGMLVRGPAGWGEFSPFVEYDDAEAVAWWETAVEAACDGWPDPVRERVPVNATVPAVSPDAVPDVLARFPGCTTAKVKVAAPGQDAGDDLDRLAAVRAALGPAGRIRVDVNGAWDVPTATSLIPRYERAAGGLEYVEQPCASVEELAHVRRRVDVPVAADESIRRAADPLRVVQLEAADVVVLKVQPLGGVRACLRLAAVIAKPVVVSSALETSVGIAAGVALAAALPALPYACGLATVGLLAGDVVAEPLHAQDGSLPVGVVAPDAELLRRYTAAEPSSAWWHERAERVAALTAG